VLDRIAVAVEHLDAELFADPEMREVSAALAALTAARMSRAEPQD
jgi:hypothetical protein